MYTTITIKTPKALRDQAKALADKLSVPLTTVINAYLGQFVRERSFTLSLDPVSSKNRSRVWKTLSTALNKKRKIKSFKDIEALVSNLGFLIESQSIMR